MAEARLVKFIHGSDPSILLECTGVERQLALKYPAHHYHQRLKALCVSDSRIKQRDVRIDSPTRSLWKNAMYISFRNLAHLH